MLYIVLCVVNFSYNVCDIIFLLIFLYRCVTKKVLNSLLQINITTYFSTNTTTSLQQSISIDLNIIWEFLLRLILWN